MQILCRSQLEMLVLPWHHFRLYAPHLAPHMYCQTSQTSLSHLDSHCAFFFGPTHPCVGQTVMCFLLLTVASLVILFQLILFLAGLFFLFLSVQWLRMSVLTLHITSTTAVTLPHHGLQSCCLPILLLPHRAALPLPGQAPGRCQLHQGQWSIGKQSCALFRQESALLLSLLLPITMAAVIIQASSLC